MNDQNIPQPHQGIQQISPYIPGKSSAPKVEKIYKLSSNETPLGPSPKIAAALSTGCQSLELYPDGSASELRKAIAGIYQLNPDHIVCGSGSDEVLHLLAQTYLSPGDEAIYSRYGFLMYRIAILAAGATPVVADETDFTANVDAILANVTERTRLIYLANPNNPTGTYLPVEDVERLIMALPSKIILVLDAAYAEYVGLDDYEAGTAFVEKYPNVVMTRTFSKIYGLAGIRLGWAYCPPAIADSLNRIRGPFNVNALAIKAGVAAVQDQDFIKKAIEHNSKCLADVIPRIRDLGLEVTDSVGNFILIHFADTQGKTARDADAFLTERGLILRAVGAYGLPHCLRMTLGTKEANSKVIEALEEFMSN